MTTFGMGGLLGLGGQAPINITSINFQYGANTGGAQLVITGSGFTGATSATVVTSPVNNFTVVSNTKITLTTQARSGAALGDVVVTGGRRTGTLSNAFEYVDVEAIFGANLVRHYSQTYTAPNWTDMNLIQDTTQADTTARPASSTLPNGHLALSFDGVNDCLSMSGPTGTGDLMGTEGCVAFIAKMGTQNSAWNTVTHTFSGVEFWFGYDQFTPDATKMTFGVSNVNALAGYAVSNSAINDNVVHRYIGYFRNSDSPQVQMNIDGVVQTSTGSSAPALGDGNQDISGVGAAMNTEATTANFFTGLLAEVIVASAKPTATQLLKLDAYLRDSGGQSS